MRKEVHIPFEEEAEHTRQTMNEIFDKLDALGDNPSIQFGTYNDFGIKCVVVECKVDMTEEEGLMERGIRETRRAIQQEREAALRHKQYLKLKDEFDK